jgi:hypothetical protein
MGKKRQARDLTFDVANDDPLERYDGGIEVSVDPDVPLTVAEEVLAIQNAATDAAQILPHRADELHRRALWKAMLAVAMRLDEREARAAKRREPPPF